jgi:Domain of unknown function (DUF4296)
VKRLIIFFIVANLVACTDRTSVPKNIIQPEAMQKIMKDVIIVGVYSDQFISKDTSNHDKRKANNNLMDSVFKLHKITREEFKQSLSFYESRPDLNKMIFDSLAADANQHKPELYAPKPSVRPLPVKIK